MVTMIKKKSIPIMAGIVMSHFTGSFRYDIATSSVTAAIILNRKVTSIVSDVILNMLRSDLPLSRLLIWNICTKGMMNIKKKEDKLIIDAKRLMIVVLLSLIPAVPKGNLCYSLNRFVNKANSHYP